MRLILVLLCLLASWSSLFAQTTANVTMEDGQYPDGHETSMAVKPRLVTEGGNTFFRLTGSADDKSSLDYLGDDPEPPWDRMNRSTKNFTGWFTEMPRITDANRHQFYRADLRLNTPCQGCSIFELWQAGPGGAHPPNLIRFLYGRVGRSDGHVYLHLVASEFGSDRYWDLGAISKYSWHNYALKVYWHPDPSRQRTEAYLDGRLRAVATGHDMDFWEGMSSLDLPMVKLGLYGIDAVGTNDMDNIYIAPHGGPAPPPSDSGSPPPPAASPSPPAPSPPRLLPLPPPTNVRWSP
jgi:hypothetical protein